MDFLEHITIKDAIYAVAIIVFGAALIYFIDLGKIGFAIPVFIVLLILVYGWIPSLFQVEKRKKGNISLALKNSNIELETFSKAFRYFSKSHPLQDWFSIDYKASYQRNFIIGRIEGVAFSYHEELLFPLKKSDNQAVFHGVVVSFSGFNLEDGLYQSHLLEEYKDHYIEVLKGKMVIYINGKMLLEQREVDSDIRDVIKEVEAVLQKLILFKKLNLTNIKESLYERTK